MTHRPWLGGQSMDVPCTIEIEHSADYLHAHVELQGAEIGPGDQVLVHDAPTIVPFGTEAVYRRRATLCRAGLLGRIWTKLTAYTILTELYEIGFSVGRTK